MDEDSSWKTVVRKGIGTSSSGPATINILKKDDKINQPCWFYNMGGCKNKDGTEKKEDECRYLHIISPTITRPQHINPSRPCDKFNLEGFCKFGDYCKYSHKNLTPEEWEIYYKDISYTLKINNQKRQFVELRIKEMESKINILEYKLKSMDEHYEQRVKILQEQIERIQKLDKEKFK
jgi:hypothetical protein